MFCSPERKWKFMLLGKGKGIQPEVAVSLLYISVLSKMWHPGIKPQFSTLNIAWPQSLTLSQQYPPR